MAQKTVTVGDINSYNTSSDTPFRVSSYPDNVTASWVLYTPEEMGGEAGRIKSITYYPQYIYGDNSGIVEIYMRQTADTCLSESYSEIPSDMTLVCCDDAEFRNNQELTFNLDIPFDYDGSSSLEVLVKTTYDIENTVLGAGLRSIDCKASYDDSNYDKSMYCYSFSNNYNNFYKCYYRPITTFTFASPTEGNDYGNIEVSVDKEYYEVYANYKTTAHYPLGSEGYSTAQIIYTQEELGAARSLKSLSLQSSGSRRLTPGELRVYLGHTKKSEFTSYNDYVNTSDLTLVYKGKPKMCRVSGSWNKLSFDKNFVYNGSDNLVVVICCDSNFQQKQETYYNYDYNYETGNYESMPYTTTVTVYPYFYCIGEEGETNYNPINRMLYRDGTSSYYAQLNNTSYYQVKNYRPFVKFGYGPIEGTTTTVGNGTSTTEIPFGSYMYNTTQTIYTPAELGQSGNITDISYQLCSSYYDYGSKIKVYMGYKDTDTFSSNSDNLTADKLTLVYSDSLNLYHLNNVKFHLQTPFYYDGKSNLVIAVCRTTEDYNYASYSSYGTYNSSKCQSLCRSYYYYPAYADITSTQSYSKSYYRPNTTFYFEPKLIKLINKDGTTQNFIASESNIIPAIELDESKTDYIYSTVEATAEHLTYKRSFDDNRWQALYLPFALDASSLSSDFDIARINNVHEYDSDNDGINDIIYLEAFPVKSASLSANTPYIVRSKNGNSISVTQSNTPITQTREESIQLRKFGTTYTFTGTARPKCGAELTDHNAYAFIGGDITEVTPEDTIPAMRWYLTIDSKKPLSSDAKYVISFDDDMTPVKDIEGDGITEDKENLYNLSGQKVNRYYKGIIISNKKKRLSCDSPWNGT